MGASISIDRVQLNQDKSVGNSSCQQPLIGVVRSYRELLRFVACWLLAVGCWLLVPSGPTASDHSFFQISFPTASLQRTTAVNPAACFYSRAPLVMALIPGLEVRVHDTCCTALPLGGEFITYHITSPNITKHLKTSRNITKHHKALRYANFGYTSGWWGG